MSERYFRVAIIVEEIQVVNGLEKVVEQTSWSRVACVACERQAQVIDYKMHMAINPQIEYNKETGLDYLKQ